MGAPIDYTGKRFNNLTAIKLIRSDRKPSGQCVRVWQFLCDCGNICEFRLPRVKSGETKNCGCKPRTYTGIDSMMYAVFTQGASRKGSCTYNDGDMTFDQFKSLIILPCHYCGKPPSNKLSSRVAGRADLYYSGLDRMDNSRKHDFDNCIPCCHKHNTAKGQFGYQEYIDDMIHQLKYLGII